VVGSSVETTTNIIPERDIKYEEKLAPNWKKTWDYARELSRLKKYGEALVQYELLLERKDNIDEARWEYTLVALHLNRLKLADQQLEILMHNDPDNRLYLRTEADVMLALGKLDRAVELFSRLCAFKQESDEYIKVLEGLAAALEQQENWEKMFEVLKRLLSQKPGDKRVLKKLASVAIQLQQHEQASAYLNQLELAGVKDIDVLLLRAALCNQQGEEEKAAGFWQQIIARDPKNLEAHRRLQNYYKVRANQAMELRHVESLLEILPDDQQLLIRAAELNKELKRSDRSLDYYNKYLALFPNDAEVIKNKQEVLNSIARDLLAIVENDKSRRLWKDLVKVTTDRAGVYFAIANLLREQGKKESLVDVLLILHKEEPGNLDVKSELTGLLKELGRGKEFKEISSESIKGN